MSLLEDCVIGELKDRVAKLEAALREIVLLPPERIFTAYTIARAALEGK